MIDVIKDFVNIIAAPKFLFNIVLLVYLIVFPPFKFFQKIHDALGVSRLWTKKGGIAIFSFLFFVFAFGLTDANFRLIVLKPDNVPIVALIFLVAFFMWLALSQAQENDRAIAQGGKPKEWAYSKEKVLVFPDLVYIEFICLIAAAALLAVWSIALPAPLEGPANPTVSPNPSKAPWYFLGLQEMLVYFDPWIAGVVFPTVILVGLMCIPYIDKNRKGLGYYTYQDRKMAINIFMFYWLMLWVFLIIVGTFLRGPNWNFFGPFEFWDHSKLEALNNINLSELLYMVGLKQGMPSNILLRELPGFIIMGIYFGLLPAILAKTIFKDLYQRIGVVRYSIFAILFLLALLLPIKMYLRWLFNIKYIVAIPEFFFNI
jgi:hypothetical protein